ncbi:MAG: helix-turn-helix domain-containing protein [Lachnospiraceae bacterium]|nr:helix-turn-helix domain-containing protein [Lachnospiraceae bacterium]
MIGTKLKALRQQNHLSQEKLAEELGVSRNTVSKWESDICDPDIGNLKALCEYFHCDVAYFLDQPQGDAAVRGDTDGSSAEKQPQTGGFSAHWMEILLFVEIVFFLGLYILSWVVPSKEWVTRYTGPDANTVDSMTGTEQGTEQESGDSQEWEGYVQSYVTAKGFFPFMTTYHLWPVAAIVGADAVFNVVMIVRKRHRICN